MNSPCGGGLDEAPAGCSGPTYETVRVLGNNLAKPVTWSGTVVRSGNRIVLRSSQEQWISLSRSGDTLYGGLEDPVVEAVVTLTLKRAVDQS
jgi:hypothetical protein